MKRTLIHYFVKYPQPGRVKTRLAKSLGFEEAARHYRELAAQTFLLLKAIQEKGLWDICVSYDPPEREAGIKEWLPGAARYESQIGEGLGMRLSHAMDLAFKDNYASAWVLGSDTLDLTEAIMNNALEAIETQDVVIGPAADGGYYLLGLKQRQPALFRGISWSEELVLEQTLKRIRGERKAVHLLEPLHDLDDSTDLLQQRSF